jgi:hypothetical protein
MVSSVFEDPFSSFVFAMCVMFELTNNNWKQSKCSVFFKT